MMITQERLRDLLHYDPETGIFTWLMRPSNRVKIGSVAGHVSSKHGYREIRVDGVLHRAHRLAWLYMTGKRPNGEIDHENTIRDDNRLDNLRDATHAQNMHNTPKLPSNRTGFKGVSIANQLKIRRFRSTIWVNGRRQSLGYHATPEAAHAAYMAAAIEYFGEYARL